MTHKDAGQAGSGEQVRRWSVAAVKPGSFKFELWHWLKRGSFESYEQRQPCVTDEFVDATDYDRLCAENATLREQRDDLGKALESMSSIAVEAARLNDADHIKGNSIKAHKLLMALAGMIPGYRPDVDAVRATLSLYRKGP